MKSIWYQNRTQVYMYKENQNSILFKFWMKYIPITTYIWHLSVHTNLYLKTLSKWKIQKIKICTYPGNIDEVAEIVHNVGDITFHSLQQRLLFLSSRCRRCRSGPTSAWSTFVHSLILHSVMKL